LDADAFLQLAEALTGTPVKEDSERDRAFLAAILADNERSIGWSQFNELLLLVNKDRVSEGFFGYFFGHDCHVADLRAGVEKFQKLAMLCFGNFIYAFRKLSRCRLSGDLAKELGDFATSPEEAIGKYAERSHKLLDIEVIPKQDTPLVGYLSGREIVAELCRAAALRAGLPAAADLAATNWGSYEAAVIAGLGEEEHMAFRTILASYRARYDGATVAQFADYLAGVLPNLEQQDARVREVRAVATRNQDVYLTWDHMDVYFATSMRKKWEYEDLFDFVQTLTNHAELAGLKLRHFDPTQAFTENRVNKGLVESLMLKRAKCTVYSVQDTDTLGKDSELAATLAQGKPVIAYVPTVDVEARVQVLKEEEPGTIQDRLRFVIYADDSFASSVSSADYDFVRQFGALEDFEKRRVWRSVPDAEAVQLLRQAHGPSIERLCRIIGASEVRIYERRARTLKDSHPLGIQVNLDSGVANGVLVVRTVDDCARLLRRILTNSMEFDLEVTPGLWYLRERISSCVYRVVSKDRKLTNCFWNFYRRPSN
jgi:hypothetical protein